MKKLIGLAILFILALIINIDAKYHGHAVEFKYFYETLEPYGEWIELDYDNYVWRPNHVSRDWSPYSEGRWVWSNDGWYWDSYESFGWATYHYGRWYNDRFFGWVWTPGDEWAPAWVEWRYDNDYIGWAPLPPFAYFNSNYGIQFTVQWNSPYSHWRFVRYNRFTDDYVGRHCVANSFVERFFGRTKHLTNYEYEGKRIVNRGIERSVIEKRGKIEIRQTQMDAVSQIRTRNLQENDRNSINVYRPSEIESARTNSNRSFSFQKTSNNFLLREKIENSKDDAKKTTANLATKNIVDSRKVSPIRNNNVSTKKSAGKEKSVKSNNESSKQVTRQNVSSEKSSLQKKLISQKVKSTNTEKTKSNNKTISRSSMGTVKKESSSSRISNSKESKNRN